MPGLQSHVRGLSIPESFNTARLRAERLVPEDLDVLLHFHRDPAVMAELGGVRDLAQTSAYLERNLAHWSQYDFGVWMLHAIEGNDFVGRAALRHLDVEGVDEIEIGYALHSRFWGRGLATEIAEACVSIARRELELSSLVGVTTRANLASQRVLLKLGMEFEREVNAEGIPYRLYRVDWPQRG